MEGKLNIDVKSLMHFFIAVTICIVFRFLPPFGSVTEYGMAILGVFFAMVYGWSVSSLLWPALLGMTALGLTDFGTCANVMAKAFGNETIVLTIVTLLLLACVEESGVSQWLVAKLLSVRAFQGKPWVFTFFIILLPAILAGFINGMMVALIMFNVYAALFKQAGYKKGDLYPVFVLMGLLIGICFNSAWFPFKGFSLLMVAIGNSAGVVMENGAWLLTMIPFTLIAEICWILVMRLFPGVDASKIATVSTVGMYESESDKITVMQKAVLIAFALHISGCILISFFGGKTGLGLYISKLGIYGWAMFITMMCMIIKIDGKPILNTATMGKYFFFDLVFVMAAGLCIAGVLTSAETGIASMLSTLMLPVFNLGEYQFLFAIAMIAFVVTNFANNVSVCMTVSTVACSMYAQGYDFNIQLVLMLISAIGCFGLLTPSGSAYGAMIHAHEFTTSKSAYIAGLTMMVYVAIVLLVLLIPVGMFLF